MGIGYGRVSTRDQHPEAQSDGLTEFGVTRPTIYRHLDRLDQAAAQHQAPDQQRPG